MTTSKPSRRTVAVIAGLVGILGVSGWVVSAQIGANGTALGCVGNSGIIRGADDTTGACRPGDTALFWYTKAGADGAFAPASHNHDTRYLLQSAPLSVALSNLNGSPCTTPGAQAGTLELTQTRAGVAVLRCRTGTGRFIDNGDGTVTDTRTGLMWEKKVTGANCLHCVDDVYTWADAGGIWLAKLNGRFGSFAVLPAAFAGYSDWRLPTFPELLTIAPDCSSLPCTVTDPIFSPRRSGYWSASESTEFGDHAFNVNFNVADDIGTASKHLTLPVRAVRGGPGW